MGCGEKYRRDGEQRVCISAFLRRGKRRDGVVRKGKSDPKSSHETIIWEGNCREQGVQLQSFLVGVYLVHLRNKKVRVAEEECGK